MCPVLNSDNPHTMKYEYLLNGNIAGKKVLKRFQENTAAFTQKTKNLNQQYG